MKDELDMEDVPGYTIRHMIEEVTKKETINRQEFKEVFGEHCPILRCVVLWPAKNGSTRAQCDA